MPKINAIKIHQNSKNNLNLKCLPHRVSSPNVSNHMSNRAKPSQTHLLPGYKIARFQIFSNAKQPRMTSLVEDIVNLVDSPLKALLAHSDALQNDPINSKKKINRSVGQKISNPQTALKRGQLGFLDFFLGAFSVGIFAKGVQKCWSSGGEMWCAP